MSASKSSGAEDLRNINAAVRQQHDEFRAAPQVEVREQMTDVFATLMTSIPLFLAIATEGRPRARTRAFRAPGTYGPKLGASRGRGRSGLPLPSVAPAPHPCRLRVSAR